MTDVLEQAIKWFDGELDKAEETILERWRQHVDSIQLKQLPISEQSKDNMLQLLQNLATDEVDQLAENLYTGDISIGQFQEEMKQIIRGYRTSAAAVGKGGWDQMGPRDWGRLGTPIREEYKYLNGFVQKISDERDTLSLKYIRNRALMYVENIRSATIQAEAGFWFEDELPWLPKDGSTPCLVRCHCRWELVVLESRPTFRVVEATWRLGEAEHCEECVSRNGHVEVLRVPSDVEVPSTIGGY